MVSKPDHRWGEYAALLCGGAGFVCFVFLGNVVLGSVCVAIGVAVLAATYLGLLRWK